ncbi:hypothetical protein [Burkholderia multivorans]|uniref:hypothetical protein n=1 Tax=Burkholderia multivorans TaxID=87883 RepID=UPI0013DE8333|nr:hypothetical protein [Burkholderia multivorans]MBU9621027.1 hypothetical protein [Burkholderia multivorans]NGM74999.1 hypothetical protein [Burkholderia multivorans]
MDNILATFEIAKDVADPKVNGVRTGYAPHHKFKSVEYLASGAHTYFDQNLHFPGEILKVRIRFPSWEYFRDKVQVGDLFEVLELDRVVGYGKVDEIL